MRAICTVCGKEFDKRGNTKACGPECRRQAEIEYDRAYQRRYREAHREAVREYQRRYREAHREALRAYQRLRYRKAVKQSVRDYLSQREA